MKFSEKLKQAMQQLGINQAQVVGMTGKSKGSVSMYLNDKTVPSEKLQSDIAVSLGLAPDYFEQEEAQKVVKPSKCEDGIETLTVHEVAKVMHKHTNTIALGLQRGVFPCTAHGARTARRRRRGRRGRGDRLRAARRGAHAYGVSRGKPFRLDGRGMRRRRRRPARARLRRRGGVRTGRGGDSAARA